MSGRTVWLAKDADWWGREWIVDLGEEFGPAGPAAIDWLECRAKAQHDSGHVKAGFKALARGVFSDVVTVRNVVLRAVTLCLLVDYEEDSGIFKCLISWWEADQERALGAARVARHRRRLAENVTVGNGLSRSVTNTGQKRERAKALSSAETEVEKATPDDRALCRLFYELGRHRNPKLKIPSKDTPQHAAALKAMRLLRERDGQPPADIETLIRWIFTDDTEDAVFWGTTIQAPSGLRNNFVAAWAKMTAATTTVGRGPAPVLTAADLVARDEARRAKVAA